MPDLDFSPLTRGPEPGPEPGGGEKMRQINYAIVRVGSNTANQEMVQRMEIDIIAAPNWREAVELAEKRVAEGRYSLYANQYLTTTPLSRLSASVRTALQERIAVAEEIADYHCLFCGKKIGQGPRWQGIFSYCDEECYKQDMQ